MKKKLIPTLFAIVLILLIAGVAVGSKVYEKYSYSSEQADKDAYFNIEADDEVAIILQDEIVEEKGRLLGTTLYFDFDTVEKYFTDRFYVNETEGVLLYTNATDVLKINIGEGSDVQYVSEVGNTLGYKAAIYEDDTLYVAADYIKKFVNLSYELFDGPLHVQVYTQWDAYTEATINKDTNVRLKGGVKSEILEEANKDTKVRVLEEMESWSKVKTGTGYIGYVENKFLSDALTVQPTPVTDVPELVFPSVTHEGTVNMAFYQVFSAEANGNPREVLASTKGVNVISPTWYRLEGNEGLFTSISSADFVLRAHDMGVEVWALVTDVDSEGIDFYTLLSSSIHRKTLIDGLMAEVDSLGLDGINIDFEQVGSDSGEDFVQFLRELSIETRKRGVVLSVDNYVPTEYTAHYNRKEQGLVVDYVVIMGYDEYYAGIGQAGSNASIDYVENGIIKTKEDVPAEKIINAVPFYTRVWENTSEGAKASTLTMANQADWVASTGVTPTWLEEYCQNYVEYTNGDGNTVQCWLEDTESIKVKLQVMEAQGIAGVACWKLGIEDAAIWDVMEQYTNGTLN